MDGFYITDIEQDELLNICRGLYRKFKNDMDWQSENVANAEKREKGISYNRTKMMQVKKLYALIKRVPVVATGFDDLDDLNKIENDDIPF